MRRLFALVAQSCVATAAVLAAVALAAVVMAAPAAAQTEPHLTIEQLLNEGWTIAGYAGQGTMMILFRHDARPYLVQCSVLYDTTRGSRMAERVRSNCYELH